MENIFSSQSKSPHTLNAQEMTKRIIGQEIDPGNKNIKNSYFSLKLAVF